MDEIVGKGAMTLFPVDDLSADSEAKIQGIKEMPLDEIYLKHTKQED